ncbi:MAG: NADP-dependent oxidoreductase [Gammaproteobacteria bacterium]|jgi:NADPH-dependent curcumin reductase CurA|nr:NADP-dependent oxidoreductase [Gammaproteobacteria bacterium]MBP6052070.1 NADP-dependent oxidoreductase [Pseudomonadales bacterium]MBK6585228.1 NADP-dependent oxidoreductase [Gammaproteobacteria bacterium]MBK7520049.1 NADP-dependent oxidoreductase [Gammaproteobacteria bacterium]MBK7730689.1 NADP-dependent oxidoreductase [Gammaproteobacteria bacterium]
MAQTNRQWVLKSRPKGTVSTTHFEVKEAPMPEPDYAAGEVLVRNLWIAYDAAMRGWMSLKPSYMPPVEIDEPMRSFNVAQVVKSGNPVLPLGTLLLGMYGWQEYAVASKSDMVPHRKLNRFITPEMALGVLGGSSTTAFWGLMDIGKPRKGETVVVSGAAGATGSVAAQIAKLKGCRTIGIAGGKEKCRWLIDEAGLDGAIDYKKEDVDQRLKELCPDGIDIFFDNVGGSILEAAINSIANYGRIVLCGAISISNSKEPRVGPRNLVNLVIRRVRMQGFIALDYYDRNDEALAQLAVWAMEDKIAFRNDIQEGFDAIPATFLRLFEGKNEGKQLLKLGDPESLENLVSK